jgi:transposase InsO family protein
MSELCERYGVSRRIGYKWVERFMQGGEPALADQRRAPRKQAQETAPELVAQIIALRQERQTWGPRKLRVRLQRLHPEIAWPAASTMGEILRREGLIVSRPRRRRSCGAWSSERTKADEPNRVWTVDFKGEFRLANARYCYPLTVLDGHSRFLLCCRALPGTRSQGVRANFERIFREYGLPEVIHSDNGSPFGSSAVAGLSRLAVWWLRLGIRLERSRPGRPQDNGAHERLHRTLKAEAIKPPRATPELQQRAFDRFRKVYNEERPHEALQMQAPGSVYRCSERCLPDRLPDLAYPATYLRRRVSALGRFKWRRKSYFLSETLHHQEIGFDYRADGEFDLYFGAVHLGVLSEQQEKLRLIHRGNRPVPVRGQMKKLLPM